MQKIPSLFLRDFAGDPRYVTRDLNPLAAWVANGEGIATRKYDGTCVMFDGSAWWARREIKPGKNTPADFQPIEADGITGKVMGWVPMEGSERKAQHAEALSRLIEYAAGTYELCGPKVNGNPEGFDGHVLIEHALADRLDDAPRTYEALSEWLHAHQFEGIVWHHPDGRMAKIKAADFPRKG